jgi:hypothetical protein
MTSLRSTITKANEMSALWDIAIHALREARKTDDFTAFDEAMARFRKIQGDAR